MKKIILLIFVFVGSLSVGFAADYAMNCVDGAVTGIDNKSYECSTCNAPYYKPYLNGGVQFFKKCCEGGIYTNSEGEVDCCPPGTAEIDGSCVSCSTLTTIPVIWKDNCNKLAKLLCSDINKIYTEENGVKTCCPGVVVSDQNDPTKKVCIVNNEGTAGITMDSDCLTNGQCKYNIYKTLGIRKSDQDPSVTNFVQDIVLATTTFIGTVVSIILLISGVLYIVAGIKGDTSMADKAKKGVFNSMIGLIFVATSYAIVRLIQFLATGGGG